MKMFKAAIALASLGICSTAFAATNNYFWGDNATGFYIGAQGGYGMVDYGSGIKSAYNAYPVSTSDEDDIAGRAYVGYQLTPMFGLEAGYSIYSDNIYKGQTVGAAVVSQSRFQTQAVDLLGTIGTPLRFKGFGVTLKGGAAYVMSDYHHYGNGTDAFYRPAGGSNDRLSPAAGASIIYKLPNNIAADVSYLHIFAPAHVDAPQIDLITLGLSYRFA